jgi:hypothetical protein
MARSNVHRSKVVDWSRFVSEKIGARTASTLCRLMPFPKDASSRALPFNDQLNQKGGFP